MRQMFWSITKSKFTITGMALSRKLGLLDKNLKRVLVSSILFSTSLIPVYADGDNYEIDQVSINAWRYWQDHITNNQQYTTISDSDDISVLSYYDLSVYIGYPTDTNVQEAGYNLMRELRSVGCKNVSWSNSGDNKGYVTAACPAFMSTVDYSKFYYFNHLPYMTGTITQPSAYSTADRIFNANGSNYIFAFWINANLSGSYANMTLYGADGNNKTVSANSGGFTDDGGIFYYRWTGDGQWNTISIPYLDSKSYNISPIYYGRENNATNEILQMCNIDDDTVTAINNASDDIVSELIVINGTLTTTNTRLNTINSSIGTMNTNLGGKLDTVHSDMNLNNSRLATIIERLNNGNSSTQNIVNQNTQSNNAFNTASNDFSTAEVAQLDSMDNALQNINTTDNIVENFDFLSTANWVTLQFNRMVNNTPLELVISFSLILGLALVFIGKVR